MPAGNRFEVLDRIQVLAENKDITVSSGIRSSNEVNEYVLSNRFEKIPVKNVNNLTPEDKERVKAAYEKANPGINKAEVTVANNGNITYNHQGKGSIQKGEARLDGNVILDNTAPSKPIIETPLLEKAGTRMPIVISSEPKAKVEIFDSKNRKIGEKTTDERGKVTIEPTLDLPAGNIIAKAIDEAGNISQPSDPKLVTYKDFTPVVPAITPVTKVTKLTPAEIKEVKDKVQAANKGKTVEVSTNGTATVTDPISGFSHQISGTQLVDSKDKIKPTVEIPYSDTSKQEIYVYSHEENNITIKVKDNSGKISNAYLAFAADNRQGLGQEDTSYLGGGSSDGLYLRTNSIKSETTATNTQPATITVSGNINNQPYTSEKSITRYVYAEDPSGNTNYEHVGHANDNGVPGRVRFVWKPQTFKYTATANSQTQTVSYKEEPSAEASVNKTGLPAGTTYAWKTKPDTSTPGDKSGVVEVTYPDTSKDTVNVTVSVRKLSDEYNLAATEIEVNQNDQVSNDRLKTVVSATSKVGNVNGTDKISTVTAPKINTVNYGSQNITATVTFKDGTVNEVKIPIKVKDVTKPTISAPGENTNWEMTALDKTLPNMEVRAEDNANGSGIKSVSVTGLPDYLEYDKTTNSIKFKAGKEGVEKLPTGTQSKEFSLTIRAEDNAGNVKEKIAKITISSMSTKNTPEAKEQTVDNGSEPKAKDSIGNVEGLPSGTTFTWKDNTPPNTAVKTPGKVDGTVVVHYPDGTSEEVQVKVNVRGEDETYTPEAKEQTVDNGSEPKAK
ncbi:Rib/alpha-like domain-containing protein, partial [Streptococcus mitis]|uniref:Rib/alpha-like domain-containing protein n=1 Tax=Streptococcus mitis TaxID=28037 RepID=UPI002000B73E